MKGRTSIPIAVDGVRLDRILVLDGDIITKQGSRPRQSRSATAFGG